MKNKILVLLSEINPVAEYDKSIDFISDGLLDSFDIINLVVSIDSTLGVSIPGTEIIPENFQSLDSITSLVMRLTNEV